MNLVEAYFLGLPCIDVNAVLRFGRVFDAALR